MYSSFIFSGSCQSKAGRTFGTSVDVDEDVVEDEDSDVDFDAELDADVDAGRTTKEDEDEALINDSNGSNMGRLIECIVGRHLRFLTALTMRIFIIFINIF